ncbi:MAG: PQQ-binding-like beta-propeller repeat protein [Candidatus Bathyarchaeia archaeon]|jgi:outer membrane protein assembly factor BamB
MNRLLASIFCLTILLVSVCLPFIETAVAQQDTPTYRGDEGYTDLVSAENGIRFSVSNGSTVYPDQAGFSIKFNAYQNTPDNMMSLGAFLYNVSYQASWLNYPVTVYQWSINNPANLDDDDANPKLSFEATVPLSNVPQGEQSITVSSVGGGYLLFTQGDGTVYETFAKNSTATLIFTISGEATPTTPTPTINNEAIIWETNLAWNLTGTPAQNYWETDILSKSRTWTAPVVVEDKVYAAAKSAITLNRVGNPEVSWINIYAFNTVNGAKIWIYQGNYSAATVTNLAVSDGAVYFAAGDYVTALDASNGKLLWSTATPTGYSNPTMAEGKVFIGSGNSLTALDAITGNILWNFTTGNTVASSPAVSYGVVYFGSNDANLYALNTENGEKIWNFKADENFEGTPVIDHGTVYAGSADGNMYALRATDGSKIWSYDTSPPKNDAPTGTDQTFDPSSPVVVNGVLFFTSSGQPYDASTQNYGKAYGTVYAFSTSSGQMIWSTKVDDKCGAPVIDDGLVYVNVMGTLTAFKVNNGERVWSFTNVETIPAIGGGLVFFGCQGQLCTVKVPEGDFSDLPVNLEYSVNNTMFVISSVIVIALTVLILYSFKTPLNIKIKVKIPKIKTSIFKKKQETEKQP